MSDKKTTDRNTIKLCARLPPQTALRRQAACPVRPLRPRSTRRAPSRCGRGARARRCGRWAARTASLSSWKRRPREGAGAAVGNAAAIQLHELSLEALGFNLPALLGFSLKPACGKPQPNQYACQYVHHVCVCVWVGVCVNVFVLFLCVFRSER